MLTTHTQSHYFSFGFFNTTINLRSSTVINHKNQKYTHNNHKSQISIKLYFLIFFSVNTNNFLWNCWNFILSTQQQNSMSPILQIWSNLRITLLIKCWVFLTSPWLLPHYNFSITQCTFEFDATNIIRELRFFFNTRIVFTSTDMDCIQFRRLLEFELTISPALR